MIIIVCLDDNNGMLFNHRRQSQDKVLREHILQEVGYAPIWMNAYSAGQFDAAGTRLRVCEDFMEKASYADFCFVEDRALKPYLPQIKEVIIYRWNRIYPADFYFDLDLRDWKRDEIEEFAGSSHEKITRERYIR